MYAFDGNTYDIGTVYEHMGNAPMAKKYYFEALKQKIHLHMDICIYYHSILI